MELLKKGFAWVVLFFKDNSKRHIYTTLNKELILKENAELYKDRIYDFSKKQYISFDKVVSVEITANKEEFDSEVDKYVGRFV